MVRILIGSVLGGLAQFIVGFVFWGTPLAALAYRSASDADNAAMQGAMGNILTKTGAGTYVVPWPGTAEGTVLLGRGPVAMIHYNPAGFPAMDPAALIGGLILSVASILLMALALRGMARQLPDFAARLRVVVLFGLATVLYFTIGQPVYNYYLPWGYFVFSAVSQLAGFVVGGLVLVRWFMPDDGVVAPAPADLRP